MKHLTNLFIGLTLTTILMAPVLTVLMSLNSTEAAVYAVLTK